MSWMTQRVRDRKLNYVSTQSLRAQKSEAQARDQAAVAGEDRLLIRPEHLKGATVIWPDVHLTDADS